MNFTNNSKIFIVDDDKVWTAILTHLLNKLGYYNIDTFSNGKACIENLKEKPDLIFLDYQMGDLNGLFVLQEIKTKYPLMRVVFSTSYEDLEVAMKALNQGSFDFLLKSNASIKVLQFLIQNIQQKIQLAS